MIASCCLAPVVIVAHGADERCSGVQRVRAQRERAEHALSRAAGARAVAVTALARDVEGVPIFQDGVHWSQSHTRDAAAAIVAPGRVGIDIEPIQMRAAARYSNVVSHAERALFATFDALAFTRLWTAKEAVLKCAGVGMADLAVCRIESIAKGARLIVRHRERAAVVHQSIEQGFVVSLCTDLATDTPLTWTWGA